MAFTKENLKFYDALVRNWTAAEIKSAMEKVGSVLTLAGKVSTLDELNAVTGAKPGDVYIVLAEGDTEAAEYYRTADGNWDLLGTATMPVDGLIDEIALYKGGTTANPGTGTPSVPAVGTLFYPLYQELQELGTLSSDVASLKGRVKDLEDAAAPDDIPNSDILAIFNENTPLIGKTEDEPEEGSEDENPPEGE